VVQGARGLLHDRSVDSGEEGCEPVRATLSLSMCTAGKRGCMLGRGVRSEIQNNFRKVTVMKGLAVYAGPICAVSLPIQAVLLGKVVPSREGGGGGKGPSSATHNSYRGCGQETKRRGGGVTRREKEPELRVTILRQLAPPRLLRGNPRPKWSGSACALLGRKGDC